MPPATVAPEITPEALHTLAAHREHFTPRRFFANPHLQTIAGNFLPRPHPLPPPEAVLVSTEPGTQVLCHCHWQPYERRAEAPTAIIVHGLEGSSGSQYVLGNAAKLFRSGANAIRMNMRNCGGSGYDMARLTPTLYHSGLSGDVLAVLRFFLARERLRSVSLIGYSMGGNLVLKAAGDLTALGPDTPPQLRSVIAISPACDLGPSADALHRPLNRIYERRFLRALRRRYRHKAALFPHLFDPRRANGIRSLRQFDDQITAPYSGFLSADDYYDRASAARVLAQIRVPTLILHAADDPFIRLTPETRATIAANPAITLLEPPHGGHCAFLAEPDSASGYDGYWAEHTALRFVREYVKFTY